MHFNKNYIKIKINKKNNKKYQKNKEKLKNISLKDNNFATTK